jgi:hypothetical protein
VSHVSSFHRDALALGALSDNDAAAVRAHLDACAACRAEADADAAERDRFVRDVLPRSVPHARRAPMRWPWLAGIAALAAAAIVIFVAVPRDRDDAPELAMKGTVAWQVVAKRGARTFALHDGAVLAAGDQVRFVITTDRARAVTIVAIDGNGAASVYFPYDGRRSAEVPVGRTELPDSIVLDNSPGPERWFAIFTDEPIDTAPLLARLRDLGARGAAAIRMTTRLPIEARDQLTLVIEKRP